MDFEIKTTTEIVLLSVFGLLLVVPFVLNVLSAHLFSNIEFKTHTFRYLKLHSIIDTVLMLTFIVQIFVECKQLFTKVLKNDYWLAVCKLYITMTLSRILITINSLISMIVTWNQYRELNHTRIIGRIVNLFISASFIFAIILHLPNIFLYEIQSPNNTNSSIQITNNKYMKIYTIFEFLISIVILIFALSINIVIGLKFKLQKSLESQSIIYSSKNKPCILITKSSNGYKNSLIPIPILNIRKYTNTKDSATKRMIIWITLLFTIEKLLECSFGFLEIFLQHNSEIEAVFLMLFLVTVIFIQVSHVIIYYKCCPPFAYRFKQFFQRWI